MVLLGTNIFCWHALLIFLECTKKIIFLLNVSGKMIVFLIFWPLSPSQGHFLEKKMRKVLIEKKKLEKYYVPKLCVQKWHNLLQTSILNFKNFWILKIKHYESLYNFNVWYYISFNLCINVYAVTIGIML